MTMTPFLSVIMPVHRGAHLLPDTLGALLSSSLPREHWELIVVDDASPDETATVAASFADEVIRLTSPPCGPGGARNAGAKIAKGAWLVFIDADVRVHQDTLSRLVAQMRADPKLVALFGTYDEHPEARGFISVYRNLLHRYVHLRGAGESETFWAGLGAVRAGPFADVGGFDTTPFPRPQIEDIDLGYRLRDRGGRILLDPTIQGTHLKRWTLVAMVRTDIRDRGIPWMGLLLERRGRTPTSLNTVKAEKAKVVLAGAAFGLLTLGLLFSIVGLGWAGALGFIALMLWNLPVIAWFLDRRGPAFALATIPLMGLYYIGNAFAALAGLARYVAHRRLGGPESVL
jgi:glycosyltransferase involved in cell wall biosynthesis